VTNFIDSKQFYSIVGKNIKKYRNLKNYSLEVLGEKVGLTKKTVQRYETGETRIDMDRLAEIANALEINASRLLEGTEKFLGINDFSKMVFLPIVGRISCGNGSLVYEEIEGYEPTPESWLNSGGEYFYLRAKGDSMKNARIQEGDLLLIRKQNDVDDGQIAAVLINDEAVLKRVYKRNGTLILQSENPDYPPIICDGKGDYNVKILGKLKKTVITY